MKCNSCRRTVGNFWWKYSLEGNSQQKLKNSHRGNLIVRRSDWSRIYRKQNSERKKQKNSLQY